MNQAQQPEALQLADMLEALGWRAVDKDLRRAAAELRRLHASEQELEEIRDSFKSAAYEMKKEKDDWKWRAIEAEAQLAMLLANEERDHSDEDEAVAAGKVQAAVQGRVG